MCLACSRTDNNTYVIAKPREKYQGVGVLAFGGNDDRRRHAAG